MTEDSLDAKRARLAELAARKAGTVPASPAADAQPATPAPVVPEAAAPVIVVPTVAEAPAEPAPTAVEPVVSDTASAGVGIADSDADMADDLFGPEVADGAADAAPLPWLQPGETAAITEEQTLERFKADALALVEKHRDALVKMEGNFGFEQDRPYTDEEIAELQDKIRTADSAISLEAVLSRRFNNREATFEFNQLRHQIDPGNPHLILLYAEHYFKGDGTELNVERALNLYETGLAIVQEADGDSLYIPTFQNHIRRSLVKLGRPDPETTPKQLAEYKERALVLVEAYRNEPNTSFDDDAEAKAYIEKEAAKIKADIEEALIPFDIAQPLGKMFFSDKEKSLELALLCDELDPYSVNALKLAELYDGAETPDPLQAMHYYREAVRRTAQDRYLSDSKQDEINARIDQLIIQVGQGFDAPVAQGPTSAGFLSLFGGRSAATTDAAPPATDATVAPPRLVPVLDNDDAETVSSPSYEELLAGPITGDKIVGLTTYNFVDDNEWRLAAARIVERTKLYGNGKAAEGEDSEYHNQTLAWLRAEHPADIDNAYERIAELAVTLQKEMRLGVALLGLHLNKNPQNLGCRAIMVAFMSTPGFGIFDPKAAGRLIESLPASQQAYVHQYKDIKDAPEDIQYWRNSLTNNKIAIFVAKPAEWVSSAGQFIRQIGKKKPDAANAVVDTALKAAPGVDAAVVADLADSGMDADEVAAAVNDPQAWNPVGPSAYDAPTTREPTTREVIEQARLAARGANPVKPKRKIPWKEIGIIGGVGTLVAGAAISLTLGVASLLEKPGEGAAPKTEPEAAGAPLKAQNPACSYKVTSDTAGNLLVRMPLTASLNNRALSGRLQEGQIIDSGLKVCPTDKRFGLVPLAMLRTAQGRAELNTIFATARAQSPAGTTTLVFKKGAAQAQGHVVQPGQDGTVADEAGAIDTAKFRRPDGSAFALYEEPAPAGQD